MHELIDHVIFEAVCQSECNMSYNHVTQKRNVQRRISKAEVDTCR